MKNLDDISDSMCLAKWLQSTVNLQLGTTKSCCHSVAHKIDRSLETPGVLHNTLTKQQERKNLLEGKRTEDCRYCWDIEKTEKTSARHQKSSYDWATSRWNDVLESSWDKDILPSYLEISFSNTCNFACAYCGPDLSSTWMQDLKTGDYSNHHQIKNYPAVLKKNNQYSQAFWKWWPELVKSLRVFRITGGEPLLSKDTFKIMDYLLENPNPTLKLSINTNLQPPKDIWVEFLNKAQRLKDCVEEFTIYTSLEATGFAAEYIRHGLDYKEFLSRLNDIHDFNYEIMSAINILSYSTFDEFLTLPGKKYFSFVKSPTFMDVRLLPKNLKEVFEIDFVHQELNDEYCKNEHQKLALFLKEFDERRGLNSRKVFPELYETIL